MMNLHDAVPAFFSAVAGLAAQSFEDELRRGLLA
jgi:hypothetical protein